MEKIILFANFVMIVLIWLKRGDEKANPTSSQSIGLQSPSFFTPEQYASIYEPYYDLNSDLIKGYSEQFIKNNPGFVPTKSANKEPEPEPEPETTYGLLYNNQVVRSDKNINPIGTKLPASRDYWDLKNYIEAIEGHATDILNSLGFKIKYAGYRLNDLYKRFGEDTARELTFWSSYYSSENDAQGRVRIQYPDSFGLNGEPIEEKNGFSIRLMVENPENWTEGDTYTDADGNVYQTVKIGNQVWLNENLKTTKFIDGTPITLGNDLLDWQVDAPRYCWPNGDINNV